ncbi:hypothetical protein EG68_04174 [Paragonimus skrjabini miyazakii]|uniref:Glycosyl hydrolase family 13 catalytic domain-containing protein n=1 Tax=Paragonimus skrjabini miyazakii TaxID=59628 RepID=A0A8S9YS41_9TREM|nr:hypothetical protein EG68_04174 [Paragonimus skrjabini miyazakii]
MSGGDLEGAVNGEEVTFLPHKKPILENNTCNEKAYAPFLTREDLLRLDIEEPIWRRIRIVMMVLFWILWFGLLAASIIIIILTPKCPPTPKLNFWQSKVGYWVDPFAFRDSGSDFIGDFKGLIEKLDYIKDTVGAGFVILGSFVSGHYTNTKNRLGLVENFTDVDTALGSMDDFRTLIKAFHRKGVEVVVTLDFNSISLSNSWASQPSYLQVSTNEALISRAGVPAVVKTAGGSFYSASDDNAVDLNLTSDSVFLSLTNVIEYWLKEGADGILLSNAAFYVEDFSGGTDVPNSAIANSSSNKWFDRFPSSQIFTNGSVQFVQKVRKIIDYVSTFTSRQRLLAVDTGDVGFGLQDKPDIALDFLGTSDAPAAHMVVSRQFAKYRGWKVSPASKIWEVSSVKSYNDVTGQFKSSLALITASPSDPCHADIISLASIFLLPGTPLLYYGSELAVSITPTITPPQNIYPMSKVPFPNLSVRDSELVCQLPMPWDQSGLGFSSALSGDTFKAYLKEFGVSETVESVLSFGRGHTPFNMVEQLVQLRQKPSLLWGAFEELELGNSENTEGVELFTRTATGYPPFIIAFLKQKADYGAVFNFTNVCPQVIPRLTYPLRTALVPDKAVSSSRIYLKANNESAVYVFECA